MRGLKKLLALLLAVTMIASVIAVPVFAADEEVEMTSGEKLELLGLLKGDVPGAGVTETYLAKSSTRMQLAILNARWLGYEEDAYAFEDWDDDTNFIDYDDRTDEVEWNMLGYYYADEDLGFIGIGGDVFAPQDNITNKQLAKILLVAMGYPYGDEYAWNDILSFAAGLGISMGSSEVGIDNAAMADAIVAALEAFTAFENDDGEAITFAQYLLDLGIVTKEDLIKAKINYLGLEDVEDVELPTLEVKSAVANNFAEVELTFNQKVDPDSTDLVVVKVDNNSISSKAKVYVVDDYGNGTVVRIYEPDAFVSGQNEYRTISVAGLKTKGGIAMTAYSQQITFRDSTPPSIEKIVAKGNTRLDVHFSEPLDVSESGTAIKTLSNYLVGGKALSASAPTIDDRARKVTIKNIKTTLAAGIYVIGIQGTNFKDFAGNTLGYQTAEFEVFSKTEGPIAQKVLDPVFRYKVQIEFDDEIQDDATIRWIDGSKSNASEKTSIDGNVATFEFKTDSRCLPVSGTTITIVGAKDYWNNAAQQPLSFDVKPVADTLRPAVTGYGANNDGQIWIKFNKDIDKDRINFDKWVIKNPDGDTIYDNDFNAPDVEDRKITLTGKTGAATKPGKYKITLKNVYDTVRPRADANAILDVTIEVEVADTDAPYIINAVWGRGDGIAVKDHKIINITFSKEVDFTTAVTRANYRTSVKGASYKALPNTAKVGLQSGNRTVTLTFRDAVDAGTDGKPTNDPVKISVIDVQDLVGNRCNHEFLVGDPEFMTEANIKKDFPKVTDTRKIEIEFTSKLSTYNYSDFKLFDKDGSSISGIGIDTVELNKDCNKITIGLTADVAANGKYKGVTDLFLEMTLLDFNDQKITKPVKDGIAPKVLIDSYFKDTDDSDYQTGAIGKSINTMFLVFNEEVKAQTSWNDIFDSIKIGGDVFLKGKREKDDGYFVDWEIHPIQKKTDEIYILQIEFIVNPDYPTKPISIGSSEVTFTYNRTPGKTIRDMNDNELAGDAFKDISLRVRIVP